MDFNKLKALKGEPKKPKDLLFLRIGKYDKDGEWVRPTTQFNLGIPPPMFNRRLTTAHRRFRCEIADIVGHIGQEICTEKFESVKAYINWSELAEAQEAAVSFDEAAVSDEPNLNPQTPETTSLQFPIDTAIVTISLSSESATPTCREGVANLATPSPPQQNLKPHYDSSLPNSKYTTLNHFECDLMNCDEGSAGVWSKFQMDNVLRDIVQFEEENHEDLI